MIRRSTRRVPLAVILSLATLGAAQAAAAGMTFDLLGSSHLIEMQSVQWGVGVSISSPFDGSRREASAPSLSEITWSQEIDTTVPLLSKALLYGTVTPKATMQLLPPGGAADNYTRLSIETRGTAVTGVSTSAASGAGLGSASASVGYETFLLTYATKKPADKWEESTTVGYDLKKAESGSSIPTKRAPTSVPNPTPTAAGIYMRLGGTTGPVIAGDSRAEGYENWVAIDSAQMGMGASYSVSGGTGGAVSKPSISELTITQQFDGSVPAVLGNLFSHTIIEQVTIEFVTQTAKGAVTFMQLVLDQVMFSGLSLSTSGQLPQVSESLNFLSFSQRVWDINSDGSRGDSTQIGYDLVKQQPLAGKSPGSVSGFGSGNLQGMPSSAGAMGSALEAPIPAVPEPRTWLLMLAGLGLLLGAVRRRKSG